MKLVNSLLIFILTLGTNSIIAASNNSPVDTMTENIIVSVNNAYIKAPVPGTSITAAYMTLTNNSDKSITLETANSPAAMHTELHESSVVNSTMKMRKLDKVVIKAGDKAVFKPGANHFMLIKLTQPLKDGDNSFIQLQFSDGRKQLIELPVMKDAFICPHSGKLMSGAKH